MTAVALDIEFDEEHILCAATCWTNGLMSIPQLWCSQTANCFVHMTGPVLSALLDTLWQFHVSGVTLVTWGGTGCDWPRLIKACNELFDSHTAKLQEDRIRQMTLASVDIPLVSVAANGMMMGLNATAFAMGLGSRVTCDSEHVPLLWNSNDPFKQNEVVQHVKWDAWATVQIWSKLMLQIAFARPQISWMTQKSGFRSVRLHRERRPDGSWTLPTVQTVLTWKPPTCKFSIPAHLRPSALLQWLS